jgi:hypothetical protein
MSPLELKKPNLAARGQRQDQAAARLGFFLISQSKAYRGEMGNGARNCCEIRKKWEMGNGKSLISQNLILL